MAKIKDLLNYYPQIVDIFRRAGAQKVLMFKGFTPKSEHDLNILIIEYQVERQTHPICRADITDGLTSLLRCTVCVTDKQLMLSEFYEQLNEYNSFELSLLDTLENRDQTLRALQHIFGTDWEFIKREPYDREATEEEWQHYCAEMEEEKQWIEQHDREQDQKKIPESKGAGFFSQSAAITKETATLEISIACCGLLINKTFVLAATPSPSELRQNLSDKIDTLVSDYLQQQRLTLNQQKPGWDYSGW